MTIIIFTRHPALHSSTYNTVLTPYTSHPHSEKKIDGAVDSVRPHQKTLFLRAGTVLTLPEQDLAT